jgi:proteasomal ATPase-associated factor 1
LYDIRNTKTFVKSWEDSTSPVLSLLPFKHKEKEGYFVGRYDGTCLYHFIESDEIIQLTGSDFEPINDISSDGSNVFTACRDGKIRKYALKN